MKKSTLILSAVIMAAMAMISCNSTAQKGTTTTSINSINTVTIGQQVWMVENLNVATFRNGDSIPEAKTKEAWKEAGNNNQPAWSYYDNKPENGASYGKLYNWYAVTDPRGLAPEGWKIPSNVDWSNLTEFLGGESLAGDKIKSSKEWTASEGQGGTNESGFTGLPCGNRNSFANFSNFGDYAYWWSATEHGISDAWYRFLEHTNGYVGKSGFGTKKCGYSVRCLQE